MSRRAIALSFIFAVSACAEGPAVTANNAPAAEDAAAAGSSAQIMIFGTDERWTGRLTYTAAGSADEVFDFLHREMPNFGWIEISAMRSDNSLLTFTSESTGRLATINIRRGSVIGSTQVDMVVAPKSGN